MARPARQRKGVMDLPSRGQTHRAQDRLISSILDRLNPIFLQRFGRLTLYWPCSFDVQHVPAQSVVEYTLPVQLEEETVGHLCVLKLSPPTGEACESVHILIQMLQSALAKAALLGKLAGCDMPADNTFAALSNTTSRTASTRSALGAAGLDVPPILVVGANAGSVQRVMLELHHALGNPLLVPFSDLDPNVLHDQQRWREMGEITILVSSIGELSREQVDALKAMTAAVKGPRVPHLLGGSVGTWPDRDHFAHAASLFQSTFVCPSADISSDQLAALVKTLLAEGAAMGAESLKARLRSRKTH